MTLRRRSSHVTFTVADRSMEQLTPFEQEAIATILREDHPAFAGLRTQLARCEVSSREFTGVGFFTTLTVPADVPSVPLDRRLALGDVHVTVKGVEHGVGLVLFVEEGRLAVLEGFTYDGAWPDEMDDHRIDPGGITHFGGSLTDGEQADAASAGPEAVTWHSATLTEVER